MPGSPSHLIRRFADVVTAEPLEPPEIAAVHEWLDEPIADIFFEQAEYDQRHGYHAATVVIAGGRDARDIVEAALMHDVGKRHARLGVLGRSLASVMIKLRLPLTARMTAYRDHGELAARELGDAGASQLAIDFAGHHHGSRPNTIDEETWHLLQRADQPPKAGR